MTKKEILEAFEAINDPTNRDTGSAMQRDFELARTIYSTSQPELIEILRDWLADNSNPPVQRFALNVIDDLKIVQLKLDVENFREAIMKTRKPPFLEADLKAVEETISTLSKRKYRKP